MKRRTFLKGSASAAALSALSKPLLASVLQPPSPADTRELSSGWGFYRGPLDGRYQVWNSQELVVWETVTVPHCFNAYDACDPDTPAYRGQGWYRTHLPVANPYPHGRTLLHFEGAGQECEVWIGSERVSRHVGGYDEFVVDITNQVRAFLSAPAPASIPNGKQTAAAAAGGVPVAVLCDNGRNIDRMPSDLSDFTLYGGLYRPVHLVYVPAVSLEAVHTRVDFVPAASARVSVTARLYAPEVEQGTVTGRVSVFDPAGSKLHATQFSMPVWNGEKDLLTAFEIEQPQTWSPKTPHLYRCEVTLEHEGTSTNSTHNFGIRHTRWEDHGPFYLNGERLLLRGTQRHEDHAGYAAAMPAELIRQEMHLMRDMGANMVRLAHYQQRRLVLELCDELGLFVWEELPWCRSGVVSATFQQLGKELLRTMIDQHRNHTSVLIWGLGNEDDWPTEPNGNDHQAIRRYMTELRELAHAEDPTRMTGYRRCDFAKDIPDVYSPSIWAGWYSGIYTEYAGALEKGRAAVPHFLHVEWGADSHAGRNAEEADAALAKIQTGNGTAETGFDYKMNGGQARVSRDGTWSETYACDLFDWYLKTQEQTPWLTGTLQWIFKDFTTPLRVENPVPRVNQKGLLTRDMSLKEGYFVFQSYWSEKPMLRVFGHNWPVRWGKAGQPRLVRVYSNCSEVELFVNGKSAGKRKRDMNDFPCAGLRWNVAFREGENEVSAVGSHAGQTLSDSVRFRYETRAWGAPAKLALSRISGSTERVTVRAELLDAAGVRCLDSRAQVRFASAGAASLIDNLGTPDGSRVVQLYNGRAEISLERRGAAVVSVSAAELAPAFLNLG